MGLCWGHLGCAERAVVFAEARRGASQRESTRCLGRSASTVCRELRRGRGPEGSGGPEGVYCPQRSAEEHARRRLRCRPRQKLAPGGALWRLVCRQLLDLRWSPEQIAATLARMHPDDPAARVSHETIHAMNYARGGLKAALVEALRQGKPKRGTRRRALAGSAIVPERLRILHRPKEVQARLVPGHWEGDLIKGAFNRSSVGTLVERKTRFVTLARMEGNGAEAALAGFTRQMRRLPGFLRPEPGDGPAPEDRHLHLAIPMRPGSAGRTRTPTGSSASSCPRAPTSRPIPSATSTASPGS